jgi:tetratricopeptide (TPR) repeat protein
MTEAVNEVSKLLLKVGKTYNNKQAEAIGSILRGEMFIKENKFEEAKVYLSDAVEIYESNHKTLDEAYQARAFRGLASIERELGNIQEALEYLELTLDSSKDRD